MTQDDLQYHSLSKQQNDSPQPLVGTGKVSESHGCGKPLPLWSRQMQTEQPVRGWAGEGRKPGFGLRVESPRPGVLGGTGGNEEGLWESGTTPSGRE